jgi:asparagine synthase (glutamine-hydrolysing)
MSVQFGRWNIDGKPVDQDYLEDVKPVIARYGPNARYSYTNKGIGILYYAFHTTEESRHENQPHVTKSGTVITWDGRLDNRPEILRQFQSDLTTCSSDVSIVAAAYEEWGTDCLARLIGDWAISVWDPKSSSLLLAKDPIGTRPLYYSVDNRQVTWCSILDPLVLFSGKSFAVCEEYIAGWLSFFPATHLTPYIGIRSVPPSSMVSIQPGRHTVSKYWDFDPHNKIRYRTDGDYEEHFRAVFDQAVRRRLRSDSPILAELSGGMDSSSIVCMADNIIARGAAETPRLDTVSWYDDSETNWDERPYFTKVEEKRGSIGTHIDVGSQEPFEFEFGSDYFAPTPGAVRRLSKAGRQFAACVASRGSRVVLSGIGGDEVTGGVPTPTPELQDHLARGRFTELAHQLKAWALFKREPWFHLLFDAVQEFLPPRFVRMPEYRRPAHWLDSAFVKRNHTAFTGYRQRITLFGALPSFQGNLQTLDALRRQLACSPLSSDPLCERRYPYLDRSLLEFVCAIEREQLVRPGQRRSLMRRALAGIVPEKVLNRRRKAFVVRGPMTDIAGELPHLLKLHRDMLAGSVGIIDTPRFQKALEEVRAGRDLAIVPLLRTIGVEVWLRSLTFRNALGVDASRAGKDQDNKPRTKMPPRNLQFIVSSRQTDE